jgi:hypothetical protein
MKRLKKGFTTEDTENAEKGQGSFLSVPSAVDHHFQDPICP